MSAPIPWDSSAEPLCGEGDPYGRSDTANQYARTLWNNFIEEHNQDDGSHKSPGLPYQEEGSYVGVGKKHIFLLENENLDISGLILYPENASITPMMKTQDMESVFNANILIESDDTDGSTLFTDTTGAHTITANGGVQHFELSDEYLWGQSAVKFDGVGDYLSVPDSVDWDFGTGAFSVGFDICFINKDANATAGLICHGTDWAIFYDDANSRLTVVLEGTSYHFTWSPSEMTWYNVVVYRSSSSLLVAVVDGDSLFCEGTTNTSFSGVTQNITGSSDTLKVGTDASASTTAMLNGYLVDIWIYKGNYLLDWSIMRRFEDASAYYPGIIRLGRGRFQLGSSYPNAGGYLYFYSVWEEES